MGEIDRDAVLGWFTGRARECAGAALDLLVGCITEGCWRPKASRSVRAALSKSNVAQKLAEENESWLAHLWRGKGTRDPGWRVFFTAAFGHFEEAQSVDFAGALAHTRESPEQTATIEQIRRWATDFAPVVQAIAKLDATRPKPAITSLGISPLVARTLTELGATRAEACPMDFELVEGVDGRGSKTYCFRVKLLWPEGTVHQASRYQGTANNAQCESCGHAIKSGNFVPLVLTGPGQPPKSLWVGRDCARSLFGIKVTGQLEFARGQRPT
jgi:hypothetical protein